MFLLSDLHNLRLRIPSYSGRGVTDFEDLYLFCSNSELVKRTQYANGQLLPDHGMPDSDRSHPTPNRVWANRAPLKQSQTRVQLHWSEYRLRGKRERKAQNDQGSQDVADTVEPTKKKHHRKQKASAQERIIRRFTIGAVLVSYWYANLRAACHIRPKSNGRRHRIRPGVTDWAQMPGRTGAIRRRSTAWPLAPRCLSPGGPTGRFSSIRFGFS
jgi:hypothetical protein